MATLEDTTCCGLDEIDGLNSTPELTLKDICADKYPSWEDDAMRHAFILFTDVWSRGRGRALAAYIKKHKLGIVIQTPHLRKNPNSGNRIRVWVWAPNENNLKAWWKINKKDYSF